MHSLSEKQLENLLISCVCFALFSFFVYLYRTLTSDGPSLDILSIFAMITLSFLSVAALLPKAAFQSSYTGYFMIYLLCSALILLFPASFMFEEEPLSIAVFGAFWLFMGFTTIFLMSFKSRKQ